jgi:hypothetical protein
VENYSPSFASFLHNEVQQLLDNGEGGNAAVDKTMQELVGYWGLGELRSLSSLVKTKVTCVFLSLNMSYAVLAMLSKNYRQLLHKGALMTTLKLKIQFLMLLQHCPS